MAPGSAVPPPVTAVLDASQRWLPARLAEVEDTLRLSIEGWGGPLGEDAGATLAAGGKRLRPMLVLLCAGESGGAAAASAYGTGRRRTRRTSSTAATTNVAASAPSASPVPMMMATVDPTR